MWTSSHTAHVGSWSSSIVRDLVSLTEGWIMQTELNHLFGLLHFSVCPSLCAHTTQNDFEGKTVAASFTNATRQLWLRTHFPYNGTNKHTSDSHSHAHTVLVRASHMCQNGGRESSFSGATRREPYSVHPLIAPGA